MKDLKEKEEKLNVLEKDYKKNTILYNLLHKVWSLSAVGCSLSVVALPITYGYGVGVTQAWISLGTSMGLFYVMTIKSANLLDNIDNQRKEIIVLNDELNKEKDSQSETIERTINNSICEKNNTVDNVNSNDKDNVRRLVLKR